MFSRGNCTALDLGFCRIRKTASHVVISGRGGGIHEAGFSLLIKEPGLYKLKGVTIELLPGFIRGEGAAAGGFFVSLPLVFRRSGGDDHLEFHGKENGGFNGIYYCKVSRTGSFKKNW
jgi:tRNA(Ile)-lysidine synthase